MAATFRKRGDISMVDIYCQVVGEKGLEEIVESEFASYLEAHPQVIEEWVRFSEDQRCTHAHYLAPPGYGVEKNQKWSVGFLGTGGAEPEEIFKD